eukprot:scpid76749/ scgid26320/ 
MDMFFRILPSAMNRILAGLVLYDFHAISFVTLLQAMLGNHIQLSDTILVHGYWQANTILLCKNHLLSTSRRTYQRRKTNVWRDRTNSSPKAESETLLSSAENLVLFKLSECRGANETSH